MATLFTGFVTSTITTITTARTSRRTAISRLRVSCVGWDPEGILGPPQTGHIAKLEFKRRLEKDSEAREAFEQHVREEKERRRALRQSRIVPDTPTELIEYFLDTEAQEIEFEIARMRPLLNNEFFSHLQFELGQLRFGVSKTQDMEDRLIELEALQKALLEGTEAYDKMQVELITAKKSLTTILTSKDVKATLLEMVERNELNRSLLTLLDENISNAQKGDQKQAAAFMEKVRGAVLNYLLLPLLLPSLLGRNSRLCHRHQTLQPTDFIKKSCKATRYPALCVECLSGYSRAIRQSDHQLAITALSVSLHRAKSAAAFVGKLTKVKGIKRREYQAVKDCIETMGDSIDMLGQSVRELGQVGRRSVGQEFIWHMSNVQTWVSAALTDETTCLDGFSGRYMNGNVKNAIRRRVTHISQVTSNALALVNRFATKKH
ncbi:hypothetical protein LWI29_017263 [Acer saccharum]|uniref:Pectinesterase inhibitor domain-containing protein n=1 Tax=Acer saccharum TaxID=4024 RepID=A0AA39VPW6_ACESA|nr:hypothetical protein LWI29_017263 [Acer saccharum]